MHAHDHGHGHAHGGHAHGAHAGGATLLLALCLTLGFAFVEAFAGWWAGSLALLGDAGHMLTDSFALGLATLAAWLSRRPPGPRLSYGMGRLEPLAALINGITMLIVIGAICWHAVLRLLDPQPVSGEAVTIVALIGLGVNILAAWLLSRGGNDLNTRAALLHVFGDLLGSVAALVSGLVIQWTGWLPIDPLLSMLICGLILASTASLLRQVFTTLLDGVPDRLSLSQVGTAIAAVDGVGSVHDLHIWSLGAGRTALSAHLVIAPGADWHQVLPRVQDILEHDFGIDHSTLQPESPQIEPLVFKRAWTRHEAGSAP
ncbi:cation transporter [Nitrogeniibacter mangrovi]|uniref:Cation transporter n=1 Tax=Nitrogeniibacter mangrovi TaxID=2016596 RepID=A0A6C1B5Z4_9RHOO|nr:cation diffusion facilitator family transporter [Nitrogeniibacter mangrovi]QID17720.1 cation transporter [Nitrogeniibacter mangrovi]